MHWRRMFWSQGVNMDYADGQSKVALIYYFIKWGREKRVFVLSCRWEAKFRHPYSENHVLLKFHCSSTDHRFCQFLCLEQMVSMTTNCYIPNVCSAIRNGFCLSDVVIPGFCSHCVVFLQWNIGRLSSHSERYIHGKDQNNDTRFIFIFSFIVFAQKRSFLKRHRTAKWAMPSLCLSFLSIPKKSYLFFFILSLLQPLLTITLQSHLPLLQWVVFKVNQPRVQLYW